VISGHVQQSRDKENWNEVWLALQAQTLFSFKSKTEEASTSAIVLKDYRLCRFLFDNAFLFCLIHEIKETWFFRTQDEKELLRWMKALEDELGRKVEYLDPSTPSSVPHQLHNVLHLATADLEQIYSVPSC